MSKPINPKFLGENGIHRVPLWRIGGFALNNTATNLYMFLMNYLSFYLMGFVGVGMMMASSFVKTTTLTNLPLIAIGFCVLVMVLTFSMIFAGYADRKKK